MDENEYDLQKTEAGTDLVLMGRWNKAAATVLEEGQADGLVLNYAKGFNEPDLRFLESWPIARLTILDRSIRDLSPVYRMSATLKELSIQTSPGAILDLKQLPDLTRLGASWGQVRDTINTLARLTHIFLLSFDSPDLTVFESNKALESIQMKDRPKIASLKGLSKLPRLEDLGIFFATRLKDLNDLESGNDMLHTLQLEGCRGITNLEPMSHLRGLKFLNASDCGDIDSIRPVADLKRLEDFYLYGTTKILDNDLSPLLQLPHLRDVRIQSRRTYRPSVAEVTAFLRSSE